MSPIASDPALGDRMHLQKTPEEAVDSSGETGPPAMASAVPQGDTPAALVSPVPASVDRLSGWRLHGLTLTVMICIFLANLEVAIVSTTLIAITDNLQSFSKSSWIITSYLLTYTGFLIIWSKISDSFGRRRCLCAALLIFIVASGACAGAQTTDQLIIFRAFQGIGGSGLLSVPYVIVPEMVEPKKLPTMAAVTAVALVLGFLFGPLFGGAIVAHSTWRWVFLLNLPVGVATLVLLVVSMPAGFPNLHSKSAPVSVKNLKEIDFVGAVLILGACAFIVGALEEAGSSYPWSSAPIIVLVVLSGVCAIAFPLWEKAVDSMTGVQAIFTLRLMRHRIFMGALLLTFFAGVLFTVSVIQIPQEWQTVSDTSALEAGIRLLPFTLFFAVGITLAMILASKLNAPIVLVLSMGAFLQILATCIMGLVPVRTGAGKYICEMILGIGVGENIGVMVQLTPILIQGKDRAAAMGAVTQFRALGGIVGFAITTNVFNAYIRANLVDSLGEAELKDLLQSVTEAIHVLPPQTQDFVRSVFAKAYDLEIDILIGFAAAQLLGVALMWERKFRRMNVHKKDVKN